MTGKRNGLSRRVRAALGVILGIILGIILGQIGLHLRNEGRRSQTISESEALPRSKSGHENLLDNPSFEEGRPGPGAPVGWALDCTDGDAFLEVEGERGLVFRLTDRDLAQWKLIAQEVPCLPGCEYTASVSYRGGQKGLMACYDGETWHNMDLQPGESWQDASMSFVTGHQAKTLFFKLGPTSSESETGMGWFDGARLREGPARLPTDDRDQREDVPLDQVAELVAQDRAKVCVIGLDGATWDLILPLMARGDLPNIEGLLRRGSHGVLRSEAPTISPALWTTMATGFPRDKHGIDNFTVRIPGQSKVVPVTSTVRKTEALWTLLSRFGVTVGVGGWWASWPAEPVQGFILTDRLLQTQEDRRFFPDSLAGLITLSSPVEIASNGVLDRFGPLPKEAITQGRPPESLAERRVSLLCDCLGNDLSVVHSSLACFEDVRPDCLMIYIYGIDGAGHLFWKYHQPINKEGIFEVDEEERRMFRDVLVNTYRQVDEWVGQIVQTVGPQFTVLVCSDHGFGPDFQQPHVMPDIHLVLERLGYCQRGEKGIQMDRSRLFDAQADWAPDRQIYANLKGREPQGIVSPEEMGGLLEEACARLAGLMAIETGAPLFEKVSIDQERAGKGGPEIVAMVNVDLSQDDRIQVGNEAIPVREILPRLDRSGGHVNKLDGILIISGPTAKTGQIIEGADVLDVAPTILALMGLPMGKDMPGEALTQAMRDEHLARHPLRYVQSYETGTRSVEPLPSSADSEILNRLKGLGYLQ